MKEHLKPNLEIIDVNSDEVCDLNSLLHGATGLVILFSPHSFDDVDHHTMESLINNIDKMLHEFRKIDVRVICITR